MLRVGPLIVVVAAALLVTGTPVAAEKAAFPVDLALEMRAVPSHVAVGKPFTFVATVSYKSGTEPLKNVGVWMIIPGPSPVARPGRKTIPLQNLTISMPQSCAIHWSQTPTRGGRHGVRTVVCNMSGLRPGQMRTAKIKIASRISGRVLVASEIWTGKARTEPGEHLANINQGSPEETWITVGRR
jgi:hypothetical protein